MATTDYAPHPGDALRSKVVELGLTYEDVHLATGISVVELEGLVDGTSAVNAEVARDLARCEGMYSKDEWLALKANFERKHVIFDLADLPPVKQSTG